MCIYWVLFSRFWDVEYWLPPVALRQLISREPVIPRVLVPHRPYSQYKKQAVLAHLLPLTPRSRERPRALVEGAPLTPAK